ncbi:response regulator transcription factor [Nocardioides sp. 503]|uniref:LuxR C-terminal-related transcriptional regulator n=1 Tax=Nocardioides sp. 503 TaxID=2508326 RepID=UPI001431F44D|nr:response regulator transcription factor [Nocardioides sp. 503]
MPTSPRPVRITLVNDYPVIVSGVATMLEPYADRIVLVEVEDELPADDETDLVLFDMFAHLQGEHPALGDVIREGGPKVVVFTWVADPETVASALRQGAAGYLSKSLSPLELVKSLEDICSGAVVTSDTYDVMLGEESADAPTHAYDLSPREAEVLALIAKGLSNKEIARTVFLSVNSIKTYIRTAYAKTGVHSRSQAVVWAHENNLVPRTRKSGVVAPGIERR